MFFVFFRFSCSVEVVHASWCELLVMFIILFILLNVTRFDVHRDTTVNCVAGECQLNLLWF